MKGEWVYEEKLDRWHLIVDRLTIDRGNKKEVHIQADCLLVFPGDTETKPGSRINGLSDSVHDTCYRKSEELP